jgi:hypothetical protein
VQPDDTVVSLYIRKPNMRVTVGGESRLNPTVRLISEGIEHRFEAVPLGALGMKAMVGTEDSRRMVKLIRTGKQSSVRLQYNDLLTIEFDVTPDATLRRWLAK